MKKCIFLGIFALAVGGCISSKSTTAPGDVSTKRIATVAAFSGIYSNYGVDADKRQQLSMLEVLLRRSDPALHSCDSVAVSIVNGDIILFQGRTNGKLSSTVLSYFHKEEYTFSKSVVYFKRKVGTVEHDWGGSHNNTYEKRFWLSRDEALIIEESDRNTGFALGLVPAVRSEGNVYRYERKKG